MLNNLPSKKHIILIGFMCSGKTLVSKTLGQIANRVYFDLDNEIEKEANSSIKNIFKNKGEAYFRDLETKILKKLLKNKPSIISTGGGIVESQENINLIKTENIFYLKLSLTDILKRLNSAEIKKRPLAKNKEKLKELFKKREPIYNNIGVSVKANKTPVEISEEIIKHLFLKGKFFLKTKDQKSIIESYYNNVEVEIKKIIKNKKAVLLLDETFKKEKTYWENELQIPVIFPSKKGEKAKTLEEAEKILVQLAKLSLARDDYLIVKGGGSLTDLGAFIAGLYKRGLNLIIISTTILASVDAAIGGKTAVNLFGAKNQIGHFYLANKTLIDFKSFKTLTKEQLAEGLVESYKTGLILDEELALIFKNYFSELLNGDIFFLNEVICRSYQAKAKIVSQDFKEEKGIRDILNLGHTYGHVLEAYLTPKISHGEAVAIGLAVAAQFSFNEKLIDEKLKEEIITISLSMVNKKINFVPKDKALNLLQFDKKIRNNNLRFIALKGIGKAMLLKNVSPDKILLAAEQISGRF